MCVGNGACEIKECVNRVHDTRATLFGMLFFRSTQFHVSLSVWNFLSHFTRFLFVQLYPTQSSTVV